MKNICAVIICILALTNKGQSQIKASEALSQKIANKLRDSLELSLNETERLYDINMDIFNKKKTIRQFNAADSSIRIKLQKAENMRDSLYEIILPNEKFKKYLRIKKHLVSNN